MCKKIHRGGNAEQYHADKKYKEAVAVAVEACAEEAKGQTCYICLESVHPHTKEGLVRGCACQGNQGFAHVSCLVRQDEILVEEATRKANERMQNWIKKQKKLAGSKSRMTTEELGERLSADIINENEELANLPLSCKLCKTQHDASILRATAWGTWKQCVGKLERRLKEDYLPISAALTNLVICLEKSGHTAEAVEIERAYANHRKRGDDFRN